jgi:hypothetical protein
MEFMNTLAITAAIIFLIFAALLWRAALEEIRPKIPPQFRDEYKIRFALDGYIWDPSMPVSARRKYIGAQICISIACAAVGVFMFIQGTFTAAMAFAAVSILGAVLILLRCFKYRERF